MTDDPSTPAPKAQIISLSKARKAIKKQDRKQKASENRLLHGRTGAQKKAEKLQKTRDQTDLDRKKLDD